MWRSSKQLLAKAQDVIGRRLHPRAPTENKFLLLLPVVGVLVGFISIASARLITWIQNGLWDVGPDLLESIQDEPPLERILIPVAGGFVVGLIGWIFKVRTRGGGINTIIQGVALRGGF
ncbi:MAG TPA: hypothetical protein VFP10_09830, partial [Candidatus Eisenbacteria bacterium]|nr:hypothetical protein [Candidatus Eisenbacteria bacterium]